jgi:hypothetical protein
MLNVEINFSKHISIIDYHCNGWKNCERKPKLCIFWITQPEHNATKNKQ